MRCWVGERLARARANAALLAMLALLALTSGCNNNPWPEGSAANNTLFSAAIENSPRHLDPTASYWSNETPFTYQIYEPPYGYHYLKRPYELVPKTAAAVVVPYYVDKDGRRLSADAPTEQVEESVYDVPIKPGILYQPHPAFAVDEAGRHRYHALKPGELGARRTPLDFAHTGTRELVAEDFVYAVKRHATTRITTPIASLFSEYVVGLKDYSAQVEAEDAKLRRGLDPASLDKPFLDFRRWPLAGATAPEKHLLRLRIKGKYPQWRYWMSTTFLAPVPWEADAFYAQPGMARAGLSLDRWPVGTGPFMMETFVQDRSHSMVRNPNYRGEPYPCEGMPEDQAAGRLKDCGKKTPFLDRIVITVEREAVPQRNKFRQGYYDIEVFERTDTGLDYLVAMEDSPAIRREYTDKGFRLQRGSDVGSYFIAFNMLDPVVGEGGDGELSAEHKARNRKLRQALSIAIDWEEYSRIFPKKGGQAAMSPLPPGIPGSRDGTAEGVNPITHFWRDGQAVRRPLADAQRLMVEAGYPRGRDAKTGKPLVLNYDYYAPPTPERKPEIDWVVRQFAKLDIQLEVRATDNNQFQDKVRKGKYQVFWLGWNADYPDAENFLFLLYSKSGKTKYDGENTSNYDSAEFDRRFLQMKTLPDGPQKQALIDELVSIVREDAPWTMGFFPWASAAIQRWVHNANQVVLIRDTGRYLRIDTTERAAKVQAWNRPVWWPLLLLGLALLLPVWAARRLLARRERLNARGQLTPDVG
jgi:ABC-type transport system substrate-binding protein